MTASALALSFIALTAIDPTSGVYRPAGAPAAAWKVNEHHTLLWNEQPYIPIGVRIDPTDDAISQAKAAGIGDALVKLSPASDWSGTVKKLEGNGFRYMIAVDGIAPGGFGIAVEPQTYRMTGLVESRKIELPLVGAKSALLVLATARDGTIVKTERVDTPDGKLSYQLELPGSLEHVLIVYPEIVSQGQPDYWERFDLQRDTLLIALKKAQLGPGFRGLVNPLGDFVSLSGGSFVPTSPYFRMEFRQYVENRYRNIETAQRAWAMGVNDLDGFDPLSRLVPLWAGTRGISYLWDPQTNKQYKCNNRNSAIWGDIQAVINLAAARRFDRLVSAIRQIVDVPVVQDWRGWVAPYEAAKPAVTGIGMRARGATPSALAESGGRAASSLLRWAGKGWLLATDVDAGATADSSMLGNALADLGSMGARGFFFRTSHPDWLAAEARSIDASLAQWSPIPVFYPESAANPASAQGLPGGHYWLPSPAAGNRVDLGSAFFAYRYQDREKAYTAIWTTAGSGRVKLRLTDPKSAKFETVDGSDPKVKVLKNGVEVTMGTYPLLVSGTDEVPIPEASFAETVAKFEDLKKLAETMHKDVAQEEYVFRDSAQAFDRSPGGSFLQMRRAFWTATARMAPYTWVEAEISRVTNFSEVVNVPGALGGAVLSLTSPSSLDPRGFFAEYTIPVKAEEVEIWVAARMSPEARKSLRVVVGGQEMTPIDEPMKPYGPGFAWYRMGATALKGTSMKISVQVFGEGMNDIQVDTILIGPSTFPPRGPLPPELIGGG